MRILSWVRGRRVELLRFGTVGALAFVVDLGLFNLLLFGDDSPLQTKVVTAKVVSAAVATVVAWMGNRLWTFSERRAHHPVGELIRFGVVNVVALVLQVAVVAFAAYVLRVEGQFATNAAAVVGIGIGTIARYIGYRRWVFTGGGATA